MSERRHEQRRHEEHHEQCCPAREPGLAFLQRAADGELTAPEATTFAHHRAHCARCAEELAALNDLRALFVEAATTERVPLPVVAPPRQVRRRARPLFSRAAALLLIAAGVAFAGTVATFVAMRPTPPSSVVSRNVVPVVAVATPAREPDRASLVLREEEEGNDRLALRLPTSDPGVHVFWVYSLSKGSSQ